MKWMIASDIHGSLTYLEKLLSAFEKEAPARLILLGDLLYHGPRNALPEGYLPMQAAEKLNALSPAPMCVRGNCDADIDQVVLSFPAGADYALLPVGRRMMFMTHGHLFSPDALPPLEKGDILLTGHTHVPAWRETEGVWYLNPGSVSIPKENSPHGYMVLEDNHFTWKTLEGETYHSLTLD